MLNKDQNLNSNIFSLEVEKQPIRKGFGEGLLEAGKADERIVGLCADLTESTKMNLFAEAFPARFIEVGVAEQNLVTTASGMAAMGKIPFVSSYAMFSPGRNWEQIRTTITYNDVPVKIVGSHAGVSVGPDGGTHQAIEDIALMRVLPNMVVLSPCDAIEAKKATLACAKTKTPTYVRLARENTPIITTEQTPFEIGKANVLWRGNNPQVVIIGTGALVHRALIAAKMLSEGDAQISVTVINVATIKPLDEQTILKETENVKGVISLEEHQVTGGLGGALAELFAKVRPTKMKFLGVQDKYGQSGTQDELIKHYGMDEAAIVEAVKSFK